MISLSFAGTICRRTRCSHVVVLLWCFVVSAGLAMVTCCEYVRRRPYARTLVPSNQRTVTWMHEVVTGTYSTIIFRTQAH